MIIAKAGKIIKHRKNGNMRYKRFLIFCCVFIASLLAPSSHACTTFCLDSNDALVVGRNFDWETGDALIIVNKRNVSKTAGLDPAWIGEQPVSWTSKYGNVTFNPLGREFPLSGMNEVGLVVSAMRLGSATKYPKPDSRPAITAPQWIQYQLDNYATVGDVLASDLELRISNYDFWRPFHYFVCDSTGTCATIEFIDEKLVYHTQETLPVKVLANSIYSSDLEYWEKKERPNPESSPGRFYTAALRLEDYDPGTSGSAIGYTFNILSELTWRQTTQWSIAYDILNRRITFYTDKNEDRRYVDLSSFDFLCSTPVKVLDISEDLSGDVSDNFIDYTYKINRDLIEKAYAAGNVPNEVLYDLAYYPETTDCYDDRVRYKEYNIALEDYNLSIWDFSGTYTQSRDGKTLNFILIQDAKGKVTGSGTFNDLSDENDISIDVEIKGNVKGKNSIVTLKYKVNGKDADGNKLQDNVSLELNEGILSLVGTEKMKTCAKGAGCEKTEANVSLDMSDEMKWEGVLLIDVETDENGKKLEGSGELILYNGDYYRLSVKGKYNSNKDETQFQIKGVEESTKGIKFKLNIDEGSGAVTFIRGKALGQKLKY